MVDGPVVMSFDGIDLYVYRKVYDGDDLYFFPDNLTRPERCNTEYAEAALDDLHQKVVDGLIERPNHDMKKLLRTVFQIRDIARGEILSSLTEKHDA